jgi:hypothetical protein
MHFPASLRSLDVCRFVTDSVLSADGVEWADDISAGLATKDATGLSALEGQEAVIADP